MQLYEDKPGFQSLSQRVLTSPSTLLERSSCPTRDLLAVVSEDRASVSLWRQTGAASSSTPVWTIEGLAGVRFLAWDPTGSTLAIASGRQVVLQSVHPPSSTSHEVYPPLGFEGEVEDVFWHALELPALADSAEMAFVKQLHPLKDIGATLTATVSLLTPVSDKIELSKQSLTSFDKAAPGFPRAIHGDGTSSSLLTVVEKRGGQHLLHLFLAGGFALGGPVACDGPVHSVQLNASGDDIQLSVFYSVTSTDIALQTYSLRIDRLDRHLAQAMTLTQSMLQTSFSSLEDARKQWMNANTTGRAWLAKMDSTHVEDTLLQVLMTGRSSLESVREYLSSKAAERSYQKWDAAAAAGVARLASVSYSIAAPTCERVLMLFSAAVFEPVHKQAEATLRQALELEEAARTERRMFAEVAKFLRHELDRHNRMDIEPPPVNAAVQPPPMPPLVPAVHNPSLVAKWLKACRAREEDEEDHLVPWVDALIESLGQLARVVREACRGQQEFQRAAPVGQTAVMRLSGNKSAMLRGYSSTVGEARLLAIDGSSGHLFSAANGQSVHFQLASSVVDCGFFDDEELALLLRDESGRGSIVTLSIADLLNSQTQTITRCQYLDQVGSPLSLALNGRDGRRTGCAIAGQSLEVFDMEAEEEEGDAIEEDT